MLEQRNGTHGNEEVGTDEGFIVVNVRSKTQGTMVESENERKENSRGDSIVRVVLYQKENLYPFRTKLEKKTIINK